MIKSFDFIWISPEEIEVEVDVFVKYEPSDDDKKPYIHDICITYDDDNFECYHDEILQEAACLAKKLLINLTTQNPDHFHNDHEFLQR